MRKPKQPHPPRCICIDLIHWIFGIVSPTLALKDLWYNSQDYYKVKEWREKVNKYKLDMIQYKIEKRTCTKEEYKTLMRHKRKGL